MQGVGQHAGHALHHHLVGGLEESGGQALGLLSLWNWHSRGTTRSYRGETGIPQPPLGSAYLGEPHLSPTPNPLHLKCHWVGLRPGPVTAERLSGIPGSGHAGAPSVSHPAHAQVRRQLSVSSMTHPTWR